MAEFAELLVSEWRFWDILMFATGAKHFCAAMEKTIDVRFVFPSANSYPRPSSSTCSEELTLSLTALGTFVLYPTVYLAGDLGGVYAILLAHLTGLILVTT
ncbi:hypothetical protein DAPPUDRAFT_323488 [Daphnia pulex]|uniref:Uncharacterized protein n=1 Tax=Daphnia pulex TaxID=6669 RepID=E9GYZ2_DAPPU|nr:hypothetical protein DAPPUDRAFT_323488 [Daphnia pulex]|eukprot:EFX75239.1 hypothetical protein DAPPUDRAFT_323488 [Daphnia pulex]